jgi:hypothetical protein
MTRAVFGNFSCRLEVVASSPHSTRIRLCPVRASYLPLQLVDAPAIFARQRERSVRIPKINPLWSLADPLSVEDGAALIAGCDPHSVDKKREFFRNIETHETDSTGVAWVHRAQKALESTVMAGHLKATIRCAAWQRGWNEEPDEGEAYAQEVTIRDDDAAQAWGAVEPHAVKVRRLIIYRVVSQKHACPVTC